MTMAPCQKTILASLLVSLIGLSVIGCSHSQPAGGSKNLSPTTIDGPSKSLAVAEQAPPEGESSAEADRILLKAVTQRAELVQVNDKPHRMDPNSARVCGASGLRLTGSGSENESDTDLDHSQEDSDPTADFITGHGRFGQGRYCDIFVSPRAVSTIKSGSGTYQPGTVIVKAKYPDRERSAIELFTVMRKREAGYDTDGGDWEYSIVDRHAARVRARGLLETCRDCHEHYAETDFVSRAYLE